MKCVLVTVMVVMLCVGQVYPIVFTKCKLTEELQKLGFPRSFISNWVCLVESESGKSTSKVTDKANGSKALGLFQINSKEWCSYGRPGGECSIKCEDLINDDIRDDAACAKKVHGKYGFRGWDGWVRACYRRPLPLPTC